KALDEYELNRPGALVPRPKHLSESQRKELREGVFEAFLILADVEMGEVGEAAAETKKAGAEQARQWIERAKATGITAQILPYRESLVWELLGDAKRQKLAAEQAKATRPTLALDWYLFGQEAFRNDDLDEAVTYYRDALQLDPKHFW